ncbi:MAG: hypothetical protein IIC04_01860 [Proteobacteria bacterium]|nr:hypothetical protein [Pseudomonadota bacterium]
MAELEGAALKKALIGNKVGAGIGAGGEIEGGEAARQSLTAKGAGTKAAAAKGAGAAGSAAKTAASGAILSGKGLGLGLGLWGLAILGAIGAMAVCAYWRKRLNSYDHSETDAEIKDALG